MKSKYVKPLPPTRILGNGTPTILGASRGSGMNGEASLALVRQQAQTLVSKFGGPRELSRLLSLCSDDPQDHIDPSTIYRWMYPKSRGGTGGEIPLQSLRSILKIARLAGVMLTTKDIYPDLVGMEYQGITVIDEQIDLRKAFAPRKDDK